MRRHRRPAWQRQNGNKKGAIGTKRGVLDSGV